MWFTMEFCPSINYVNVYYEYIGEGGREGVSFGLLPDVVCIVLFGYSFFFVHVLSSK